MRRFLLSIILSALISPWAVPAQPVNVPLDYWGYQFLDRMETKGLFRSHELRTRPISRPILSGILDQILKNADQFPDRMTAADRKLLAQLCGDFLKDAEAPKDQKPADQERHTARWDEANSYAYLDLYGRQSIISNRGGQFNPAQLLSETAMGGILRGQLGGRLFFYADARNAMTRGETGVGENDENFDVSKGSPVVISGPNVYRDRALAYFVWEKPWLRVQVGRDELEWGPGFHGGLSLSRNIPPADLIRLSSHFRRFTFTSAHLFLRSSLGSKYLAAHRLDFRVLPGLYIGGSETVVYGGRDIELAYLNPLMPYHVAEHHLGDRDNNTISFDATCTLWRGVKLYAEFFIDDMTTTRSLNRYFGNKFALLLGGQLSDPLSIDNLDIRWEYARIEPFVYAHDDSLNIYTHYDKVIGHWLGPNAGSTIVGAGYQLGRDVRVEGSFEHIRKGEGTVSTAARPIQGSRKKYLAGIVESKSLWGLRLVDQIRRDLFVVIQYTYSDTRNTGREPGRTTVDHLARFELLFNY